MRCLPENRLQELHYEHTHITQSGKEFSSVQNKVFFRILGIKGFTSENYQQVQEAKSAGYRTSVLIAERHGMPL